MLDPERMGKLDARETTIGATTFHFERLPPMTAFTLFDQLRERLGNQIDTARGINPDNRMEFGLVIVKIFLGLPSADIAYARDSLFPSVTFVRPPNVTAAQKLAGAEEIAFGELPAVAVYEVAVRAFCVNFTDSWSHLLPLWEKVKRDMKL